MNQISSCENIKNDINEKNKDNTYYILYKDVNECPYCYNAIKLLDELKLNYKKKCVKSNRLNIDIKDYVVNCLKDLIDGHNTLPIIFYNNKFIGGYTDLVRFLNK